MKTIQWIGVNLTLQIFRKYYFVDSSGNSSIISVGKADDFNFYDKRLYVKKGFDYRRIAWNSYFGRSSRIFSSLSKEEIPGISGCASGEAFNFDDIVHAIWSYKQFS